MSQKQIVEDNLYTCACRLGSFLYDLWKLLEIYIYGILFLAAIFLLYKYRNVIRCSLQTAGKRVWGAVVKLGEKVKEKIVSFLRRYGVIIFSFVVICTLFVWGAASIPEGKNWIDYLSALGGIGAVGALIFMYLTMRSQNIQWLYQEVKKHEIGVILDFYKDYKAAMPIIDWFLWCFIPVTGPQRFFHNAEDEVYLRSVFVKNWNQLNYLNNKYCDNQEILDKTGITENIKYLWCLLSLYSCLPNEGDFEIVSTGKGFYALKDYDDIVLKFAGQADYYFSKEYYWNVYKDKEEQKKYLLSKFAEYHNAARENLLAIKEILAKNLFTYDGKNINLNGQHTQFYPNRNLE